MRRLTLIGDFPTPYGVTVPIYSPPEPSQGELEAVLFDVDGAAICAGIHDQAERARFAKQVEAEGRPPAFEDYGGHPVPRVALPRPEAPIYPTMPNKDMTPVEAWVTAMMDRHRWCDRAEFLLHVLDENMSQSGASAGILGEMYPLALSTLLTAALEHLGETEIDCLEAAAFYAVSMHAEYSEPGIEWLRPFRDTWFRDWAAARPRYTAFVRALQTAMDLPEWLGRKGGRA